MTEVTEPELVLGLRPKCLMLVLVLLYHVVLALSLHFVYSQAAADIGQFIVCK